MEYNRTMSRALRTIATLLLGIVFLMVTKPALTAALLVMAIALVLGMASGLLAARTTPSGGQHVAPEADRTSKQMG